MSATRTTPYPYEAGSLMAFVDGVLQPVTETDPLAGIYELPEDPDDAAVHAYFRVTDGAASEADTDATTEETEDGEGNADDDVDESDDGDEMAPDAGD